MKNGNNYVEFPIPEGLDLQGMEEGTDKEVVAVIRKKEDGTACLISVDGVDVLPYEEPKEVEEEVIEEEPIPEDAYADYAARAKQSLM